MIPKLTASGKNLLLRALAGETINFTKIQLGNGPGQEPLEATALVNPLLTVDISKITEEKEYVTLTAQFSNGSVTSGFHITEAGFFARDPDDETREILYAIGNEDESTSDYVPDKNNRILEMQFDALIFIGDAENVTAAIGSSLVYVSKDEFDHHTENKKNPHTVTKEQVGLGNVPNVTTNDQTPIFTETKTFANINSGEKVSTLFGKIKLAIDKLIDHIDSRNNPHFVTASQVGAAKTIHTHSAADINSGVIPVNRGGTGVTSLADLEKKLSEFSNICYVFGDSYSNSFLCAHGFVTTDRTNLCITIALPKIITSNLTVDFSECMISMRKPLGGYLESVNFDVIADDTTTITGKKIVGNTLTLTINKSDLWNIENNTPVCGHVGLTVKFS